MKNIIITLIALLTISTIANARSLDGMSCEEFENLSSWDVMEINYKERVAFQKNCSQETEAVRPVSELDKKEIIEELFALNTKTYSATYGLDVGPTYEKEDVINEAHKRGLLTDRDFDLISRDTFGTGMTEIGLITVMGKAHDVNKTVGSWGVHKQYVFGSIYSKRVYVYTENGIVVSWQN